MDCEKRPKNERSVLSWSPIQCVTLGAGIGDFILDRNQWIDNVVLASCATANTLDGITH